LVFLREGSNRTDSGILATEVACFNWQCDCFVTKRLTQQWFELKEVTNSLRQTTMFMGEIRRSNTSVRSIWLPQAAPKGAQARWSFLKRFSVKSRVIASVMGPKLPITKFRIDCMS